MSTLIAGGIAVCVFVLGVMWRMLSVAKKSGIDEQKTREAQARDENLTRIKNAAAARPVDGVPDPHDRDNR